jgi:hypothetical protein
LGIWISYSFVMVVGIQIVYLTLVLRRWRYILSYAGMIVATCLPLMVVSVATLRSTQADFSASTPISPRYLIETVLAGDPLRYGLFWPHTWVPIGLGLLAFLGLWRTARRGGHGGLYYALQAILPLSGFFLIGGPLLQVILPMFEWKQFLVLLPSFLVFVALGIDQLQEHRLGQIGSILVLTICAIVVYGSGLSLQRYWTTTKSPEGLAAMFVRDRLKPGDAVVSLHYSLTAALSFYVPSDDIFANPTKAKAGFVLSRSSSVLPDGLDATKHDATPATIRHYPQIWLMSSTSTDETLRNSLVEHCVQVSRQDFPPFQVQLVRDCR